MTGQDMYDLASRLYPLNRSLTGYGNRATLDIIGEHLPEMRRCSIPSGTKCFDWTVPDEWSVKEAYIEGPDGNRVVDFADHNLHLVGYSVPVNTTRALDRLQPHLHSRPDTPDAIPYVTSYYNRDWGFCLTENQRRSMQPGMYHVVVNTELKPGRMDYGELIIPGATSQEVLLSAYICHPSQANDGLSGIVVTTALAKWIQERHRRYTYRILFLPETIGSIAYLSTHRMEMMAKTVAGFVVTCCGDNRGFTLVRSPSGDTLADRAAKAALGTARYADCSWLGCRGSDERQYCSPRVNLPVVALMRSGWQGYPEYHTSADDMSVISPDGLQGGYDALQRCLCLVELNHVYRSFQPCEPFMERYRLYHRDLMDLVALCDSQRDTLAIAEQVGRPAVFVASYLAVLAGLGILEVAG